MRLNILITILEKQIRLINKLVRRSLYLAYYIKELNFRQLLHYLKYSVSLTGKSGSHILLDIFLSVYRYNISIMDYFYFRFFELEEEERRLWAGTGFMYEYQLIMNPTGFREVLADKIQFLKNYKDFIKRRYVTFTELRTDESLADRILTNSSGRIVLKNSFGQVGSEVEVISCNDFSARTLLDLMRREKYNLVEEYIVQHKALMTLSPTGVNTIRIFTQLHNDHVYFLGARLRISVNSRVDNMAAGNLAAPVDISSGMVNGPAVYSDITKSSSLIHPITGVKIAGFVIPFWKELIQLVERAALHIPQNRSVGWDIAITERGPELIEGNHNWCKLLWQLPVRKGLKSELEKFL